MQHAVKCLEPPWTMMALRTTPVCIREREAVSNPAHLSKVVKPKLAITNSTSSLERQSPRSESIPLANAIFS